MRKMPDESADLIYLDPPFNSGRHYNLLYKNTTGLPIPEQIEAFCDTWELDYEKAELVHDIPNIMRKYGIQNDSVQFWRYVAEALKSANPRLLAYLMYMTVRLIEMRRIVKQTGSIYLHCDPTASHYLKIVMDSIFGFKNFRNEIVWAYSNSGRSKIGFSKKHDIILFYSKSDQLFWNERFKIPYTKNYIDTHFKDKDENDKQCRKRFDAGKWRVYYPEEGMIPNDWWSDIPSLNAIAKERLGYPTQKPLALLERIIAASSKESDTVFDPFCGCGVAIEAAIKNNRQWIGCDIAIHAITLVEETRIKKYGLTEHKDYEIEGLPQSAEQARCLFEQDSSQFQYWAVEKTGGFCSHKKTADKGIDGRVYFEADGGLRSMLLSIKGGTVKPADIRALRGLLEREKAAELAGCICLKEPTEAMMQEADAAGFYAYQGMQYPRVQILAVQDILNGKKWRCPSIVKQARKDKKQAVLAL